MRKSIPKTAERFAARFTLLLCSALATFWPPIIGLWLQSRCFTSQPRFINGIVVGLASFDLVMTY